MSAHVSNDGWVRTAHASLPHALDPGDLTMPTRHILSGHGAARGTALGQARVRLPHILDVAEHHIPAHQTASELTRLHAAIGKVQGELQTMRDQLHGALAKEVGEFLDIHTLLLDDPELLQGLDHLVAVEHYSADYALRCQRDRLAAVFEGMDDAYFRSRIEDIDQVIGRVHAALHQHEADQQGIAGEILITHSISPSELVLLQKQGVLAVITTLGSVFSHTAILARSLHLPLIVGVTDAIQRINDGDILLIDGGSGEIIIAPNDTELRAWHTRQPPPSRAHKTALPAQPARTLDGVPIHLYANADSVEDAQSARAQGVSGIGLYRTELLFLQCDQIPDEDAQFSVYRDLVLSMQGAPVTIRTLDIGADKTDRSGIAVQGEANPALGLRGVRLLLARPDLLRSQLRAILRASALGPVRILIPMVSAREELIAMRDAITRIRAELQAEGHAIAAHSALGAMIEVPSAALALPSWIDLVEFLALGTNDLVQYLLAVDRTNDALDALNTPLHPAVPRLLRRITRTARAHLTPLSVCGEIAGDAHFTPLLLALGIEALSMHPDHLPAVRHAIAHLDRSAVRAQLPELWRAREHAQMVEWLASVQPG